MRLEQAKNVGSKSNPRYKLNRWASPDSIIPDPYNPQDWDRYNYVRNNPLKYVDPDGHFPFLLLLALVGAAVALSQVPSDQYQTNPANRGNGIVFGIGISMMIPEIVASACITDPDCPGKIEEGIETANTTSDPTSKVAAGSEAANAASDAASGAGQQIIPKLLQGNVKWGLTHIMNGHGYNSTAAGKSLFSSGIGEQQLNGFLEKAVGDIKLWTPESNGLLTRVMNTGQIIGTDLSGNASSWIKIVVDATGKVISMYPVTEPVTP